LQARTRESRKSLRSFARRRLTQRQPHLARLGRGVAHAPTAVDPAALHDEPFHGDELERHAGGRMAAERADEAAALAVADGDGVALGGHGLDLKARRESPGKLAPGADGLIGAA